MAYNRKTKMDFLDPRKRRAHTIRLFVGYGLVGLALLIATIILGFYTYGFDFNRKTKTIIQNGLVFVDAHPESADIYLNGQSKGKTNARLQIAEGQYNVELRRSGYRTWKNKFNLQGGSILQLVYPFLFPTKLTTKDVQLYSSAPGLATESPDRHWLLIQKSGSLTDFDQYDLTTTTNSPSTVTLPAGLLTAATGTQTLELSEWSSDNRHVVLKHAYPGGNEYIVVDRESPASSVNLTRLFAKPTMQFTLRDKKFDQYYVFDSVAGTLVTADLKTQTVTSFIDHVLAFKPHSADTVLYVTDNGAPNGKELIRLRSGADTYTIRQIAKSDVQLIDLARFDNHWYMAAGNAAEGKVYIFRDPLDSLKNDPKAPPAPVAALKQTNPQFVSFSATAGFIAVQGGDNFTVYDVENQHPIKFDIKLNLSPGYKATWMDGNRLTAVSANTLQVFDFDGTNLQSLNVMSPDFVPFFDHDYKAIFTLSPSVAVPGRIALVRTELKAATQ